MKANKKAPRVFHAKNVRFYLKNADGTETDLFPMHVLPEEFRFMDIDEDPEPQVDVYDGRSSR